MQDLELSVTKAGGRTARGWTKREADKNPRAASKLREKESEEWLQERDQAGVQSESTLATEDERAQMVRPRWMLVQTSMSRI